jgi:endonuclease G
VFNQDWELIALHHFGAPSEDQWTKTMEGEKVEDREVNEGIRISAIYKELESRKDSLENPEKKLLEDALGYDFRCPSKVKDRLKPMPEKVPVVTPSVEPPQISPGGSVTFKIPLEISIRLSDVVQHTASEKKDRKEKEEVSETEPDSE